MNSKTVSYTFGAVFVAVGILGFVPNPIVAPDGFFAVNTMHNIAHILTGVGFVAGAALSVPLRTIQLIGAAYVAVSIVGFVTTGNMLMGMVHINQADSWLHVALAAVIVSAAALLSGEERQTA